MYFELAWRYHSNPHSEPERDTVRSHDRDLSATCGLALFIFPKKSNQRDRKHDHDYYDSNPKIRFLGCHDLASPTASIFEDSFDLFHN